MTDVPSSHLTGNDGLLDGLEVEGFKVVIGGDGGILGLRDSGDGCRRTSKKGAVEGGVSVEKSGLGSGELGGKR